MITQQPNWNNVQYLKNDEQYSKYKNDFIKQSLFTLIGATLALLAGIFLLFLKNFKINDESISLFNEIKLVFESFSSKGAWAGYVYGIYQVSVIVIFGLAGCIYLYELIRYIIALCTMNKYASEQYNRIKGCVVRRRKVSNGFPSTILFICVIILEIIYVVIAKLLTKTLSGMAGENETILTYFVDMNGISPLIALPIVCILAAIVLLVMRRSSHKKVCGEIAKEDFGLEDDDDYLDDLELELELLGLNDDYLDAPRYDQHYYDHRYYGNRYFDDLDFEDEYLDYYNDDYYDDYYYGYDDYDDYY